MVTEDDLRRYADSWIRVITVTLVLELAFLTYLISNTDFLILPTLVILGAIIIITSFSSLAFFLAARDPRQYHFPVSKLINSGVALTASGLVMSSFGVSYFIFIKLNDMITAILFSIIMIGGMLIFYPTLYHKYLSSGDSRVQKDNDP